VDDPHEHAPKKPTSPRTAIFILIAIFVSIAFYGWQALRTRQLTITSISKAGEYPLTLSRTPPSSRWIHVSGWIDGTATIQLNGEDPVTIASGNVEWKTAGDYTDRDCVLKYKPGTAKMGKLTVEYRVE